jgi:hypothetical protein
MNAPDSSRSPRPRRALAVASIAALLVAAIVPGWSAAASSSSSSATAAAGRQAAPPSLVDVVRIVDRSLVHIETEDSVGSGFFYRDGRTVVTAGHVVATVPAGGAVRVRPVRESADGLTDLGPPVDATVRAIHPDLDLAVLLVSEMPPGVRPLEPAAGERLLPRGTEVLVHGFPGPMAPTLSRGVVSAHQRDFADGATYYLLDAAIGAGSSGGPVTDRTGRLVGMATAVHVEMDTSSFNWTYALPTASVELIFPGAGGAGGASSIDPLVALDDLVGAVRFAADDAARIDRFGDGLDRLLATRTTLAGLAADLETYLGEATDLVRPTSPAELERLLRRTFAFGRRSAIRGVQLGLRGEQLDPMAEAAFAASGQRLDDWVERMVAGAIGRAAPGDQAAWVRAATAPTVDVVRAITGELGAACGISARYSVADDLQLRELDREAVIEALGVLAYAEVLVEAVEPAILADPEAMRALPPVRRAAAAALSAAATELLAAWDDLPPICRGLGDDGLDYENPVALRASLAAEGFALDAGGVQFVSLTAGGMVNWPLAADRVDGRAFYVLAESEAGEDVDLVLYAPGGAEHDFDDAIDGFPIVSGDGTIAGDWLVEVFNVEERPARVRIEVWVR